MRITRNGMRYYNYVEYDDVKNSPYDYERYGLVKHLLSQNIANTKNKVTKMILDFYEKSLVFTMKYVDILKHFKDPAWRNR